MRQSLRKPLDAGCFEGDSTRAGPKPPVQLYDQDHLRRHLQKFRQETLQYQLLMGNGVTVAYRILGQSVDIPERVLQSALALVRPFPGTSDPFAKRH
jgi:hypothetical protein